MNTQSNFFKTTRTKFIGDKDLKASVLEIQRGKSSSSPTRMPLIREYGNKVKSPMSQNQIPSIVASYNIQNLNIVDIDKLKDELIKYKNELNRKLKEYHSLKISFTKLDEENKRNVKIIEEILEGTEKQKNENNEEKESEIKNMFSNITVTPNNASKLKEAHVINNLKRQIMDLKVLLNNKDDEIILLKTSSKVSKFHELELKMKNTLEEFNLLTERYNLIKLSFVEKDSKLKEIIEERDYYKAMMLRIKNQFDESKEKLQFFQDQNLKLNEIKKNLEDKNTNSKFQNNSIKSQIREKDNVIINLKDELKVYEEFKGEKEKTDRSIATLSRSVQSLKEEIEKKNRKIKELEKVNSDIKDKIDFLIVENKKLSSNMSGTLQVTHKEKDKKIKKLEDENNELKAQIAKLKNENVDIKSENNKISQELFNKDQELANYETSNKILKDKYEVLSLNYDQIKDSAQNKERVENTNKKKDQEIEINEKYDDNNRDIEIDKENDYEKFDTDHLQNNFEDREKNEKIEINNNESNERDIKEQDYESEFNNKEEKSDRSEMPNPADLL